MERRLRGRGTETEESLAIRMAAGEKELAWIKAEGSARFNHVLMNDDLGSPHQSILTARFFVH